MTYTQDYDRWFRDVGQFLEPAGDLKDAGKLELLKAWGQSARCDEVDELRDRMTSAENESTEAEKLCGQAERKLETLELKIQRIIELNEESPSAAIEEIEKLFPVTA